MVLSRFEHKGADMAWATLIGVLITAAATVATAYIACRTYLDNRPHVAVHWSTTIEREGESVYIKQLGNRILNNGSGVVILESCSLFLVDPKRSSNKRSNSLVRMMWHQSPSKKRIYTYEEPYPSSPWRIPAGADKSRLGIEVEELLTALGESEKLFGLVVEYMDTRQNRYISRVYIVERIGNRLRVVVESSGQ